MVIRELSLVCFKVTPLRYQNGSYECRTSNLQLVEDKTRRDDTFRYFEFKVNKALRN